jgi:hypothetical protein
MSKRKRKPSTEFFVEGEGDRYLHASILMDEQLDPEAVAEAKADAQAEKDLRRIKSSC